MSGLARPGGGVGPKALNLRPDDADVPAERLAVLAFVAREVRPAAGDAGGRDVLALEDRFGLLGVGDAEQHGIGRADAFLMIALAQRADQVAIVALFFVPEMLVDGLLQVGGLFGPLASRSGATSTRPPSSRRSRRRCSRCSWSTGPPSGFRSPASRPCRDCASANRGCSTSRRCRRIRRDIRRRRRSSRDRETDRSWRRTLPARNGPANSRRFERHGEKLLVAGIQVVVPCAGRPDHGVPILAADLDMSLESIQQTPEPSQSVSPDTSGMISEAPFQALIAASLVQGVS